MNPVMHETETRVRTPEPSRRDETGGATASRRRRVLLVPEKEGSFDPAFAAAVADAIASGAATIPDVVLSGQAPPEWKARRLVDAQARRPHPGLRAEVHEIRLAVEFETHLLESGPHDSSIEPVEADGLADTDPEVMLARASDVARTMLADVLTWPIAVREHRRDLYDLFRAAASACASGLEEGEMISMTSPMPSMPVVVEILDEFADLLRTVVIDEGIERLLPCVASASIVEATRKGETPILIVERRNWTFRRDELPDPIEAMRILASAEAA